MPKNLYVTSKFIIKEGAIRDVIELLEMLSSETRAEKGCLDYCYYQAIDNPLALSSIEIWENGEAEAAHWETPHIQAALAKFPEFVAGTPEITKYHKIV